MSRLLIWRNESGYSLIESSFQLLVMGIFLQFVVLFFYWKAPIERQFGDYYATEWELFTIELQELLIEVTEFKVHVGDRDISFTTERGEIEIGQRGTVIRKLIYQKGYIPLFTNITDVIFRYEGKELHVEVTMLDGQIRERRFAIGIR